MNLEQPAQRLWVCVICLNHVPSVVARRGSWGPLTLLTLTLLHACLVLLLCRSCRADSFQASFCLPGQVLLSVPAGAHGWHPESAKESKRMEEPASVEVTVILHIAASGHCCGTGQLAVGVPHPAMAVAVWSSHVRKGGGGAGAVGTWVSRHMWHIQIR